MMRTWKRLFSCLLAGTLALSLAACGSNDQVTNQSQEEITPPADTAQNTTAPEPSDTDTTTAGGNVLVVYYSATGNTESVANSIAEVTGGDLFEITPAEPYTSDDLNWTDDNSRAAVNMKMNPSGTWS